MTFGPVLLLAATAPGCRAGSADEFKAANALYDAGKFSEAITAYEQIQPKTANLFFNLGNANFRAGQVGRAVLNYERARRLEPRDPDILANLKFAEQKLGVDDVNAPPTAWQRILRTIVDSHTPGEWSAYELTGVWLAVLALGLMLWIRSARTLLLTGAVAAFALLLAAGSALSDQMIHEHAAPRAVVLVRRAEARFAPLSDSTVHFQLNEGTEVGVCEDRDQWLLVERADGQQGWVKRDAVELVRID
jgi:tetratricopeptide (TPR) repeat protein